MEWQVVSADHCLTDVRFVFAYNDPAIGKIVSTITKSYSLPGKVDRADFIQEAWLSVLEICKISDPREERSHFENLLWRSIPNHLFDELIKPFTSTMKRDFSVEVPYLESEEIEFDFGENEKTLLSVAYTTSTENCVAVKELLEKITLEIRSSGNPKLLSTFVSMVRGEARDNDMVSSSTYRKCRLQIREIACRLSGDETIRWAA